MYALFPSYLHRHLMTLFIKSDSAMSIAGLTSTWGKKTKTITPRPGGARQRIEDESPSASFLLTKGLFEWKRAFLQGRYFYPQSRCISVGHAHVSTGPERPCSRRTEEDSVRGPVIKQRLRLVLFLQSIPFSSIKSRMSFPGGACMTNTQRVKTKRFLHSLVKSTWVERPAVT